MRLPLIILPLLAAGPPLLAQSTNVPPAKELRALFTGENFDELEKLLARVSKQKQALEGSPPDRWYIYGLLDTPGTRAPESAWTNYSAKMERWSQAFPKSVFPRVVRAKLLTSYAWEARGSGYADTVTQEGWRLFEERLRQAHDILVEAEKLGGSDPELYSAWMTVALGLGWPKPKLDELFNKGIALDLNYMQLYYNKAYYLLPRWHGEPGDWEAFAKEVGDKRGGEDGDHLYMLIARRHAWTEKDDFFKNTKFSYARMKRGFEARAKLRPNSNLDRNWYCYFACLAKDKTTARALFDQIGSSWDRSVWSNEGRFRQWQQWASPRP